MAYTCIVLIKQVPNTKNISGEVMREDGTVNRSALPAIFNPEDLNALEMGLNIRDSYGGKVIVITMGPPRAAEILRESLYRGADEVYLLSDRVFAGADTLATAYTLNKAIKRIGSFDLVLCGRQAIDGDTAQVGPQVAEQLGISQITYTEKIEHLGEGKIKALRSIEEGYEIIESRLPVLLTVLGSANIPRYPNTKLMMRYKKARSQLELEKGGKKDSPKIDYLKKKGLLIPVWTIEDIQADPERCGHSGSPTKVKRIESVKLVSKDTKRIEPTPNGLKELVRELIDDHIL